MSWVKISGYDENEYGTRRFRRPGGVCSWCGRTRRRLFQYRWRNSLAYRIHPRIGDPAFCNLRCAMDYER